MVPDATKSPACLPMRPAAQALQALDRRILLPHVVAHVRPRHRLAHGGVGEGQRVGAQVDDVVWHRITWRPMALGGALSHSV